MTDTRDTRTRIEDISKRVRGLVEGQQGIERRLGKAVHLVSQSRIMATAQRDRTLEIVRELRELEQQLRDQAKTEQPRSPGLEALRKFSEALEGKPAPGVRFEATKVGDTSSVGLELDISAEDIAAALFLLLGPPKGWTDPDQEPDDQEPDDQADTGAAQEPDTAAEPMGGDTASARQINSLLDELRARTGLGMALEYSGLGVTVYLNRQPGPVLLARPDEASMLSALQAFRVGLLYRAPDKAQKPG